MTSGATCHYSVFATLSRARGRSVSRPPALAFARANESCSYNNCRIGPRGTYCPRKSFLGMKKSKSVVVKLLHLTMKGIHCIRTVSD